MTGSPFLITHGTNAQIRCVTCHKETRLVPGPDGDVGGREVAHYKRSHVCGPAGEPWDLESAEEKAS